MAPRNNDNLTQNLDWVAVLIYILCVLIGWFNIYAAVYSPEVPTSIFDLSNKAGVQMMWIGTTVLLIICILVVDYKFYDTFAFIIYGFFILLLVVVLFAGSEINGSRSWIKFGSFSLQPAEFAKLATSLALAKYLSDPAVSLTRSWKDYLPIGAIIALPALLILLSNETGSMLVFASFAIMLYREGMPGYIPAIGIVMAILLVLTLLFAKWYIALGIIVVAGLFWWVMPKSSRRKGGTMATVVVAGMMIAVVFGVDFFINNVLQKHQRSRIVVLGRSVFRPARRGLECHPVQDRHRFGPADRKGISGRHPNQVRLRTRAKYRLHFLHRRRRTRLHREFGRDCLVYRSDPAARGPGRATTNALRARVWLLRGGHHLLSLHDQHRHDHRPDARYWHSSAVF